MHEFIHLMTGPSRYAGMEEGAVRKDRRDIALHVGLAFPDLYEVGMSYLGQKILYGIINQNPDWWAERVMEPAPDACALLRERKAPLCTLESDTPLYELDAVGFSVTHELCFTDILNMLDLARIPLRAADRPDSFAACPLILAGGGAMIGAEALSPFFDLVALGDGEELVPEILTLLQSVKGQGRAAFLEQARQIPGVYVPAFFEADPAGGYKSLVGEYRPRRRVVSDLNTAFYPEKQVAPVGAVHNRLSIEIGRGCARGCRFCHAGMVYRPCRERDPGTVSNLLTACLAETGFDEVSFLALSAGDCTALKTIYMDAHDKCRKEQVGLCLPSLRVGSVDDGIMTSMAELHRPGATLAPEAGSQRLRDVINKGITEADLILHAQKLLEHGWRQVKLYFMIGLPTETDEDLEAIVDLCRKTRNAAGPGGPRLQITAAISPFVPKPFTPFQWEEQINLKEVERRINFLRGLFRREKGMRLKWHEPTSSFLEGLLSRSDRRMADVLERAWHKGALYCAWHEHFDLAPWLEALAECGLEPDELLAARDPDLQLPWEHISAGVSRDFLWRERMKAYAGKTTADCRFGPCAQCGSCDTRVSASSLACDSRVSHQLVFRSRDQEANVAKPGSSSLPYAPRQSRPDVNPGLLNRAVQYRIWHRKRDGAEFLSQLELQAVLGRALRRARLPVAFSQGFHPLPLLSFGRALPVGCLSDAEWYALTLHTWLAPENVLNTLNKFLPSGLKAFAIEKISRKRDPAVSEVFLLDFSSDAELEQALQKYSEFAASDSFMYARATKKGEKVSDLRPFLRSFGISSKPGKAASLKFTTDWTQDYISPLLLVSAILGSEERVGLKLTKIGQEFADGSVSPDS